MKVGMQFWVVLPPGRDDPGDVRLGKVIAWDEESVCLVVGSDDWRTTQRVILSPHNLLYAFDGGYNHAHFHLEKLREELKCKAS